jgi:hypothetical protein
MVIVVALLAELRSLLGRDDAPSFRLMGEDLVALSGSRLRRAAEAYDAELALLVPEALRPALAREEAAATGQAHRWLLEYNKSIHTRIQGYLALGRRCRFEYPWPVVAILGLCEVMRSIRRVHFYGLVGAALTPLGYRKIEEAAERSDDVLRRTNRGIFADSVPTVLYALHCDRLRAAGRADLARLLLSGPMPVMMDGETRELAEGLYQGLAIADDDLRFSALAELTLKHFAREQAIFSHHIGAPRAAGSRRPRRLHEAALGRLFEARSVLAPRIAGRPEARRLVFRPFRLPSGFEMRDHAARVHVFSSAFVRSVTGSPDDYRVAVEYVTRRFAPPEPT